MNLENCPLAESILSSATDYAILAIDLDGRVVSWNTGAERLFGYTEAEMLGRPQNVLFTAQDAASRIPELELATTRSNGRAPDMRMHLRKDGSEFWADGMMQIRCNASGDMVGFVKVLRDATLTHRLQENLAQLARVDPLTGVANRTEFNERFIDMTAAASRHRQWLLVQMIDLDHFKQVNDKFGHQIGDQLLQQVARRLCRNVRGTDFVARLGGDEFVVLQPDTDKPEAGGVLATKLIGALSEPFYIEGLDVRIGASIGISVFPRDATDPQHLLRKADLALYKMKAEERNGYRYFSKELDKTASRRITDLTSVRRAVASQDFSVFYQPKVSLADGAVVGVEALLRCHDPLLAAYPIEDVIELTRQAGLMETVGVRVLEEACEQTRAWHDAGLAGLHICVNLCVSEMNDPKFPQKVHDMLVRTGLEAESLVVEITEREIYDCGESGQSILSDLRDRGILVALDDFGTGFSSLSYLSQLRVDLLKLDKSFLRNIPHIQRDCTVVSSILALARGLGIKVVAEGVETAEQLEFFIRENCDMVQGYFFSRPLPTDEMTRWLLARANRSVLPRRAPPKKPHPQPRHH